MKKHMPDILFVTGLVIITAGIFMLNIPAGTIAAGASMLIWATLMAKGGGDE